MVWSRASRKATGLTTAVYLLLGALPATAQHPLPRRDKPLFERVALSDAVVLARVLAIDPGRVRVQRVQALLGEVPEEFEVKRSPLQRYGHEVDDLAVLFLRGARTPYVNTDEVRERLHVVGPAEARRLAGAVEALLAAGSDRDRLLTVHREWLGSEDETLRRLAINTFLHPEPPFGPMSSATARELARAATLPHRGLEERRALALVAMWHEDGVEELLARLPGPPGVADPGVTAQALRMGAFRGSEGAGAALRRTLEHPDPGIRRVGLELLEKHAGAYPIPRETVAAIAESDPDPETRERAASALEALGPVEPGQ